MESRNEELQDCSFGRRGLLNGPKKLYGDNPMAACMPYAQQQKALFCMASAYSDGFSRAMRALGHDAHEIVYDLETMQKTWAKQNQVGFNEEIWRTDIILKQIEKLRPDVVYFQDIHSLPYELRKELKSLFGFIKLIVVFTGAPAKVQKVDDVDVMFVGRPSMVKIMAEPDADRLSTRMLGLTIKPKSEDELEKYLMQFLGRQSESYDVSVEGIESG